MRDRGWLEVMLQTNLATRPFYNERLVHWALGSPPRSSRS